MSESAAIPKYDVLGLGCCAIDDVLHVASYPAADAKARVTRRERRIGGLTGAALLAATRLGARCAYAGTLGTDAASEFIAAHLAKAAVDVSHAPRTNEGAVVQSTIVVGDDSGSRNIFFSREGQIGAHPSLPSQEVIRSARVLLIDYFGMEGNLRAARIARSHSIPVVADFEDETVPLLSEVLETVDHLILSADMARRVTHCTDPRLAARELWRDSRAVVVVTCGAEGFWSLTAEDPEPRHHRAYTVRAVDTTGCGDVFHGAYAAALAKGESLASRLRFAAAAAAVKAERTELPDLASVHSLMQSQPCDDTIAPRSDSL